MSNRRLTRKEFIRLGAMLGAGAALAACGGAPATPTAAPSGSTPAGEATKPAAEATKPAAQPSTGTQPTTAPASGGVVAKGSPVVTTKPAKYNEAPMLADLVKAGKLPPVEQRLPEEPLIIKPFGQIGQYGGTLRVGDITTELRGFDLGQATGQTVQLFLRISNDLKSWEPNVAKDCKVSEDKSTYTLTLRKGMKWSDGEPFTAKDYVFWYEDILQNKDLNPSIAVYFKSSEGKLMEVTAPDDYTVVIKFSQPNPSFLLSVLAHRYGAYKNQHFHPFHYLKQYHPKYNPKADEEAKAAKFNTWFERFGDLADYKRNKDLPTLTTIVITDVSPQFVKFERNPYFWQVDSEGNQLPYIDRAEQEFLQNLEMYNAKIVTGAFDFAAAQTSVLNFAAYDNAAKQGNYNIKLWSSGKGAEVFYQFNMNHPDEEFAKIHQNVKFRQAMSHAINREEINNLLYFGKAVPRQMTVIPECSLFKEEYAQASVEYDVDKANALLDELGLKWDASHKVRLLPSGKPMQYSFDIVETETPKGPITELVTEFWRAVGVDVKFKSITRQLLLPRILANEEPISLWHGDAVTDILLPIDRKWSVGRYYDESSLAPLWLQWFDTSQEKGVEPPDWFKEVLNNFVQYQKSMSPEWGHKMLKSQADNLWSIGTVGLAPVPVITRNNLRNVVDHGVWTWDEMWTWPYHAETWYFEQ